MQTLPLTIIDRKWLTKDVFELHVRSAEPTSPKAGQFNMLILPSGLKRSYSVAWRDADTLVYIIKRLEGGKGSTELSELSIGSELSTLPPLGHFILSDGDRARCFLGTGTGFAPLYYQVRTALERGDSSPMVLVFGVRSFADVFYREELDRLSREYPNFQTRYYLSRESAAGYEHGYVTEFLMGDIVSAYDEFYLCGSPAMVKDTRAKLEELGIAKEAVKFEQY